MASVRYDYLNALLDDARTSIDPQTMELVMLAACADDDPSWLVKLYDRWESLTTNQRNTLLASPQLCRIFPYNTTIVKHLDDHQARIDRIRDLVDMMTHTDTWPGQANSDTAAFVLFDAALGTDLDLAVAAARLARYPLFRVTEYDEHLLAVLLVLAKQAAYSSDAEPSDNTDRVLDLLVQYAQGDDQDPALREKASQAVKQFAKNSWFTNLLADHPNLLDRDLLTTLGAGKPLVVKVMRRALKLAAHDDRLAESLVENTDPEISRTAVLELPWASPKVDQADESGRLYRTQMMDAVSCRLAGNEPALQLLWSFAEDWAKSGAALVESALALLAKPKVTRSSKAKAA